MDIAIKQFYERAIDSLIAAEKDNQQDYRLVKESFFTQLEEHLDHAQRLNDIVSDLKNVSQRLLFIDERIRERAKNTYKDTPSQFNRMNELLVEACENMFLSVKNENYRDACKFVVIQAEIISEYLIINHDIINNWIKKDTALITKYALQYPDTNTSYLRTQNKLQAASDYAGHTWDNNKFKIINNIRNYGSHGYHESVLAKHEEDVIIVSRDYKDFFNEWFKFIKAAEKKLYSNDKSPTKPSGTRNFKGKLSIPNGKYYGFADSIFIEPKIIRDNKWEHGQVVEGQAILEGEKWKAVS
jgi:hypothetical protein